MALKQRQNLSGGVFEANCSRQMGQHKKKMLWLCVVTCVIAGTGVVGAELEARDTPGLVFTFIFTPRRFSPRLSGRCRRFSLLPGPRDWNANAAKESTPCQLDSHTQAVRNKLLHLCTGSLFLPRASDQTCVTVTTGKTVLTLWQANTVLTL